VARKEGNLYGPGVVHDGGVPHSRCDDPLVRAPVLMRPPGEALPCCDRCEPHDINQPGFTLPLVTGLVTAVTGLTDAAR
jgi:hypothetical protein